jgi:uncharacterized protein YkwD
VPLARRRLALITCALGVLGAGFAGVASAQTSTSAGVHPAAQQVTSGTVQTWRHRPPPPTRTAGPTPTRTAGPTPTTPAATTPAATSPDPTSPDPSSPDPTSPDPSSPTPTPAPDTVIDQVLAHINAARTQNGLVALTLNADLSRASELHNQLMIGGCGLSHQCPGEAGLGDRFTAQGVRWTSAGENIGYGSAGSSQAAIVGAANGLTDSMLAEQPPNDGHRRNLLNTGFRQIGLAVDRDANGLVWMTQDFVN